jgi:hypothetical protein
MCLAIVVAVGMVGAGLSLLHNGSSVGSLPAAAAREAGEDPPAKKDPAVKPLSDKELAETARKCRDAAIEWLKKNKDKRYGKRANLLLREGVQCAGCDGRCSTAASRRTILLVPAPKFLRELKPEQTYGLRPDNCPLSRQRQAGCRAPGREMDWLVTAARVGPNAKDLQGWSYMKTGEDARLFQYARAISPHEADAIEN